MWDAADRVCLWGLLISRPGQAPVYEPIMDATDGLDDVALALRVYRRLRELRDEATAGGGDLVVFHDAKPARLLGLLTRHGDPTVPQDATDLVDATLLDLYRVMREHYVGAGGLGLKKGGGGGRVRVA